jgi:hypothetical protein
MNRERWVFLMDNYDDEVAPLSSEEVSEGWHFCWDWDGLLVGPNTPEMEFCMCHPMGGRVNDRAE